MMHIAFVVIQNLKCNLIAIYECDFALFFMLPYWYLAQSTAFLMSESQKFLLDQDRIRISFVNIHILHFLNPFSNWSRSLRGICICWTEPYKINLFTYSIECVGGNSLSYCVVQSCQVCDPLGPSSYCQVV